MNKNSLIVGLLFVIVLSLSGCTKTTTSTSPEPDTTTSKASASPKTNTAVEPVEYQETITLASNSKETIAKIREQVNFPLYFPNNAVFKTDISYNYTDYSGVKDPKSFDYIDLKGKLTSSNQEYAFNFSTLSGTPSDCDTSQKITANSQSFDYCYTTKTNLPQFTVISLYHPDGGEIVYEYTVPKKLSIDQATSFIKSFEKTP